MRSMVGVLLGIFAVSGCPSAPPAVSSVDTTTGTTETGDGAMGQTSTSALTAVDVSTSSAGATTLAADDASTSGTAGDTEPCATVGCSGSESEGASTSPSTETGTETPADVYVYPVFDAGRSTAIMGGPDAVNGAATFFELCPFDDVLVGVVIWARPEASGSTRVGAPTGVAAHCASILVGYGEDPAAITLGYDEMLLRRGTGYPDDVAQTLDCPAGHVVVGFEGLTGAYLRDETLTVHFVDQLALFCAPLSRDGDALVVGEPILVPATGNTGHPDPVPFGPEHCLSGQVARGAVVGAGAWVDSFGLWCATPRLGLTTGGSCDDDMDCAFGPCTEGRCVDRPCPFDNCNCISFAGLDYAYCPEAMGYEMADAACRGESMTLVQLGDGPEHGWIHTTATWLELGPVTLGASDRDAEGQWTWADGTLFWNGGPVEGLYSAWSISQPDNAEPGQHCAVMALDGRWTDEDCATTRAFVCER